MKVTILGSGALPYLGDWVSPRAGPAHVVSVAGTHVLFDCGKHVTRQLLGASIAPADVSHLFVTHAHADHVLDFVHFVYAGWLGGRTAPLPIYGPAGISALVDAVFGDSGFLAADIEEWVQMPPPAETLSADGIRLPTKDLTAGGVVCDTDDWLVRAARTEHSPRLDSWAYRLDSDEGSVVVSGDTTASDAVVELAIGCDILVHESTATAALLEQKGLGEYHTSSRQLGRVAADAGVRTVVLVHFGGNHDADSPARLAEMVAEVGESFDGNIVLGEDLTVVDVGRGTGSR